MKFLFQIILLGSILTLGKLLNVSSHSVFSRVSPALYLLRVLFFLLGPSVLDTTTSTSTTDGMMMMLVGLYLISSLVSTLLSFIRYSVLFFETLVELDLFQLMQEALQGRFEASPSGMRRRRFYILTWQRLTELKSGALIYLSGRVLVLLVINLLQQGLLSVSLALTLNSPIMLEFFIQDVVPVLSFYPLRCCYLVLYHCGVVQFDDPQLFSKLKQCIIYLSNPIGIALLNLEMPDRASAVSLLPVFGAAVILRLLMAVTSPVLASLPAANTNLYRHAPPLTINLCGLVLPLTVVYNLLNTGPLIPCTWSLAVLATCLVTSVQGLVNISTYIIITWDLQQTKENPNTEELKHHLRVLQRAVNLLYAVAVIASAICENVLLKFKNWPALNSIILLVNLGDVGCRVRKFVSLYLARRDRQRKLNSSLTTATESQLAEHGDICSICYLNMENPEAVMTPCSHFFHRVCLKKWIISQQRDNCPHCTSPFTGLSHHTRNMED